MDDQTTRARIRALMTSGALPRVLPSAEKITPGQTARPTQIIVGRLPQERCLICKESGPQISYTYPGGQIVRLHAACYALWWRERQI